VYSEQILNEITIVLSKINSIFDKQINKTLNIIINMTLKTVNKHILKSILVLSSVTFLASCGGSDQDGEGGETKDTTATVDSSANATGGKNVFYSIPSPIQLGKMLKRAGATYDLKVLNSKDNVSKYSTTSSKALNLGVYGADMSYSAIFGQTQECMNFLECSKKLADALGSSGAFAGETIDRLRKNSSNQDSLLYMISDIFLNSNESFKDNEQSNIALLAIAGGFVEGLYVGTQVAKTLEDNAAVVTRIAELKGSFNNIVALLNTQNHDADVAAILGDMKDIKAIYDEMQMVEASPTVTADTTKNVITIGGGAKYSLTKDQLDRITTKTEILRNKIVNS